MVVKVWFLVYLTVLCDIHGCFGTSDLGRVRFGPRTVCERYWGGLKEMSGAPSINPPTSLKVVSFNVLAQSLARSEMHSHVIKGTLKAKRRIPQLIEEVLRYGDVDVINCQEVDMMDELLPALTAAGYSLAAYQRKTSGKQDGCATFFRPSTVDIVAANTVKFGLNLHDGVGTLVRMQIKSDVDARPIIVANTHLYWKPRHEGVRLRQLRKLLDAAAKVHPCTLGTRSGATSSTKVPAIVLTGDLNSLPGAPVPRVLQGEVLPIPDSQLSRRSTAMPTARAGAAGSSRYGRDLAGCLPYGRSTQSESFAYLPTELQWPVGKDGCCSGLLSAYSHYREIFGVGAEDGHPPFTIYNKGFAGCIDFIHHSRHLRVMSLLSMPEEKHVESQIALPSAFYPSDHLLIGAELSFVD